MTVSWLLLCLLIAVMLIGYAEKSEPQFSTVSTLRHNGNKCELVIRLFTILGRNQCRCVIILLMFVYPVHRCKPRLLEMQIHPGGRSCFRCLNNITFVELFT